MTSTAATETNLRFSNYFFIHLCVSVAVEANVYFISLLRAPYVTYLYTAVFCHYLGTVDFLVPKKQVDFEKNFSFCSTHIHPKSGFLNVMVVLVQNCGVLNDFLIGNWHHSWLGSLVEDWAIFVGMSSSG